VTGQGGQRGQSLVLAAILMTVLVGFTGLAIDGGEATAQQQLVRTAADGAALAASYAISSGGATLAAATTVAGAVLTADGLPTGDLTISYLDSGGAVTAVPASVATVRAVVAASSSTYFLGAVGIPAISVTAAADASTLTHATTPCAVCLMKGSGTDLTIQNGGTATLTGGLLQVNSNAAGTVNIQKNAALSATAVLIPSGGTVTLGAGATITPAPIVSPAIADPFASLAAPVVAGPATAYTAPIGTPSISPGLYSSISVPTGAALTLNPGTYVLTGAMTISGGSVTGTGVTIYLACSVYPSACPVAGSGGTFTITSGTLTLTPPTSGVYNQLTVFSDRNEASTANLNGGTVSVGGTWYTLAMPLASTKAGVHLGFGQLIVATATLPGTVVFTAAWTAATVYAVPGGRVGLTS
jgi:hypothetical protein